MLENIWMILLSENIIDWLSFIIDYMNLKNLLLERKYKREKENYL